MNVYFPEIKLIAPKFEYPTSYLQYVASCSGDELAPWHFICEKRTVDFYINILRNEYPDKLLVPFARLEESANGDLACFDGDDLSGDPKIYFHVFCYQGNLPIWEQRHYLKSFDDWLIEAKDDAENYCG